MMRDVDDLSDQALRVLAVAIKCLDKMPFDLNDDSLTSDDKFKALVHLRQSFVKCSLWQEDFI